MQADDLLPAEFPNSPFLIKFVFTYQVENYIWGILIITDLNLLKELHLFAAVAEIMKQ